MNEMSAFALSIFNDKYAHRLRSGRLETPDEAATRVVRHVMGAVNAPKDLVRRIRKAVVTRKFVPGGRYWYAAGRPYHQTQNCFDGDTRVVTRYGTKTLRELAGQEAVLMTTKGEWARAPVKSFGRQPLMKLTLTRAGVSKEIFATPGHSWRIAKNTSKGGRPATKEEVATEDLREGQKLWSVLGYGISRTPLSPAGIQHGIVYGDGCLPGQGDWGFNTAQVRLCGKKDAQLLDWFPFYPVRPIEGDVEVSGLPRRYKSKVDLTEDRAYLLGWLAGYFAADGTVGEDGKASISSTDRDSMQHVKDVCYLLGIGAYGIRLEDRISNLTGQPSTLYSVTLAEETLVPEFFLIQEHRERFERNPPQRERFAWTVNSVEMTDRVEEVFCAVVEGTHEFVLEDNILTGNCALYIVDDSREGWADLLRKASMSLMTGAGVGIVYSQLREKGAPIKKTGGVASGPLALALMINEVGRNVRQGGARRAAIWGGLHWNHPDIMDWIAVKDWSPEIKALKDKDYNFPAPLDGTNISVILDDDFFRAMDDVDHEDHGLAKKVFWATLRSLLRTGDPAFSVDVGPNRGEHLRNACCEITSRDDSDICNLGSINMAQVTSLEEMKELVELGIAFLLAGTVYSDVPHPEINRTRTKNRRLGLGLMGIHEWLLLHGKRYAPDAELEEYLKIYATSGDYAKRYAKKWKMTVPEKTRAIAPNGTIGIKTETSMSGEPIFCVAYKRRYLRGDVLSYQYVVDPTAKRLIESGISPDAIEDAYSLAEDVERRVSFQAFLQQYVDHAISSTINLPAWGSELNNDGRVRSFGNMLLRYLPKLRGITCYPDGARGGQPLTPVRYETAMKHLGEIFVEQADSCEIGKGGSCGA